MLFTVIYIVESTYRLVELWKDEKPSLLECLRGPLVWVASEGASSMADLPEERLAKFKIKYLLWAIRSYGILNHIPIGSRGSLELFDEFWTARRIEVEGDVTELNYGLDTHAFETVLPTGNAAIDSWIEDRRKKES